MKKWISTFKIIVILLFLMSNVVFAGSNILELKEKTVQTALTKSQIGALAIAVGIIFIIIFIFKLLSNKEKKINCEGDLVEFSKKVKVIGIIIPISFIIITLMSLITNNLLNDINIMVNVICWSIIIISYYTYIFSVIYCIINYRKYLEISPIWWKLCCIIGTFILVVMVGDIYNNINLT